MQIDLVDTKTIADRLGVSVVTVRKWRERHTSFPSPVARFSNVPVWSWEAVERWQRERKN